MVSIDAPVSGNGSTLPPSLSRRSSRPTTIQIDQAQWSPDVVVDASSSPDSARLKIPAKQLQNGQYSTVSTAATVNSPLSASYHTPAQSPFIAPRMQNQPLHSPCFVHSHLDKGASLADWLRTRKSGTNSIANGIDGTTGLRDEMPPLTVGGPLYGVQHAEPSLTGPVLSGVEIEDDSYDSGSLTRQLAETAVGVREMSKQLGRARVRSNIQTVLIVTKARDNRLIKLTRELALYLMLKKGKANGDRGLVVYVDHQLRRSRRFDAEGIEQDHPELFVPFPRRRSSSSNSLSTMPSAPATDYFLTPDEGQLRYWTSDMCSQTPHLFDFVVTLGGDGTVLFTSWLFQRIVPPVLPFALGSLGFLTNFDFADHATVMDSAIDAGIRVNLRMRFTCTVFRAVTAEKGKGRKAVKKGQTGEIMMRNVEKGGWEALEGGWSGSHSTADSKPCKDREIMCFTTRPVETFEVLNDLVVDRGPSPYVSQLELFGDEHHMTTVQADGLTVSTPTGSTAYSLSAGGSLVHPEIPALLITPICPHTLSFRPMLLPDSMELRICVPFNSRSTAWASFDGRGRVELKQGDHIKITASKFPFPTVCADNQSTDWFNSISRTLKWNERERQKSFVVVEEAPGSKEPKSRRPSKLSQSAVPEGDRPTPPSPPATVEEEDGAEETIEDEEEDEVSDEDEDDKFDIDDSSPEAAIARMPAIGNVQTKGELRLGMAKAREQAMPEIAAAALHQGNVFMRHAKSRSRSKNRSDMSSGISESSSGVGTPGRYVDGPPVPPSLSPRHVEFADGTTTNRSSDSLADIYLAQEGARDDINLPNGTGSRSRIPKDRDFDGDNLKTPTVGAGGHGGRRGSNRGHSPEHEHRHHHRAFAVWGQDESDSNTSGSES